MARLFAAVLAKAAPKLRAHELAAAGQYVLCCAVCCAGRPLLKETSSSGRKEQRPKEGRGRLRWPCGSLFVGRICPRYVLIGADVLIDEDGKCWLIEFNGALVWLALRNLNKRVIPRCTMRRSKDKPLWAAWRVTLPIMMLMIRCAAPRRTVAATQCGASVGMIGRHAAARLHDKRRVAAAAAHGAAAGDGRRALGGARRGDSECEPLSYERGGRSQRPTPPCSPGARQLPWLQPTAAAGLATAPLAAAGG